MRRRVRNHEVERCTAKLRSDHRSLHHRVRTCRGHVSETVRSQAISTGIERIHRLRRCNQALPVRCIQQRNVGNKVASQNALVLRSKASIGARITSREGRNIRSPEARTRHRRGFKPGVRNQLVGLPAPHHNVYPRHALPGREADRPLRLMRTPQARLLARSERHIRRDRIHRHHRCQVVWPQLERAGHALVGVRTAKNVDWMHHWPMHRLRITRRRRSRKHVIVRLRPRQPQHPSKRSHQLVAQLRLLFRCGPRTSSIQHQHRMHNVARRVEPVDALGHRVLPASARIARPQTKQRIGHRSVRIVDHRDRDRRRVRIHHVVWKDDARHIHIHVQPAHMLRKRSPATDRNVCHRQVPHLRRVLYQGVRCGMVYAPAQVPRVGRVKQIRLLPTHRNTRRSGKEGRPRDIPRPAPPRRRR